MRNQEAARYARWSAIAAGLIAAAVLGIYAQRAFREARARHPAPKAVPVTVQQQSAQFSFSKDEQNHRIFTVRASQATQFKDQNRAVLEDVWITVYGRDGSRNDNIHTRECSYEPATGDVRCAGDVRIDLQSAAPAAGPNGALGDHLEIDTSNLSFNRNTGEASTAAPVEFNFPAGHGQGVGVSYSTSDATVRVGHSVRFELNATQQTGGLPATASGSSLEIRRNDRTVVLDGPALVRSGARELAADRIAVELDQSLHARRVLAEGHPRMRADEANEKIAVATDHLEALLSPEGWIERIVADGNVAGTRQTSAGVDHFSAARVDFAMMPARNLIDAMTATGAVTAELHQGADTHVLKTDAMRVKFSPGQPKTREGKPSAGSVERQRMESVETLAPATIESNNARETTTLQAKKFVAGIGADGRLDTLLGHAGVEVRRQSGGAAPQVVSAAEMSATFDARGEWNTVEESGGVHFQQADRQATASRASIVRATDTITLADSAVISDALSRTTASAVTINQTSGEVRATGGVVSTYAPTSRGDAVGLGSGAAHVSADALSGSVNSGYVVYVGHARLWQGDAVLDSDQIELWRDEKKLQASGHVVAVFPQASGPLSALPGSPVKKASSTGPTLWKISAPTLIYWNDQGKAHLEGGVTANSDQGSLESRTLDAFLGSGPATGAAAAGPGGRQLNRVLAQGNVVVRQGERRGTADQAEYTAADGKFVLSGGQPTLANAASDTTTGHSLTFFVANDTILIDSQEGSRTVTKHRVEK
ncbi:MAG TPA: LPS export ABC transporter periplasmic protein LptC [Verrucomicrobiae bacterium]|nr:LPS export ABC transporter periplasmic protein LptC [Verrucomicrobiae bacterium]